MTAILVGSSLNETFMVTDSMVTLKENSKSHLDCRLTDKIVILQKEEYYATIVGEERILYSISAVDQWSIQNREKINWHNKYCLALAFEADKRFQILYNKTNHKTPFMSKSELYIIDKNKILEVTLKNEFYKIEEIKRRIIPNNTAILNYGGFKKEIDTSYWSKDKVFELAKNSICEFHESRKLQSKLTNKKQHLGYDFNDRFCGIVMDGNNENLIMTPFKDLSELIAFQTNNTLVSWKLIEDEKFRWSPEKNDHCSSRRLYLR